MNNVLIGGAGWVYYETIGGGQGGRPDGTAGMSGVHTAMTNTHDTPVEAFERAYPMRVRRYGLRAGSGGAGAAPGGDGIVREIEVLEDATLSLITERRVSSPWGLAGRRAGSSRRELVAAGRRRNAAAPARRQVHDPAAPRAMSSASSRPAAEGSAKARSEDQSGRRTATIVTDISRFGP